MVLDGILRFRNKICVLKDDKLKQVVLYENHKSKLNLDLGMNKMYQDLKNSYWWPSMKKDVAKLVPTYLTCHKYEVDP